MRTKNGRGKDNKTKEVHKQAQGHGCVGCDKGTKDAVRALEGVRGKSQPDIAMEAGGDKEHGEGIRERQGQVGRRGGEVDKEVARESRGTDH